MAVRRLGYWRRVTIMLALVDLAILGALAYTVYERFGIPWA